MRKILIGLLLAATAVSPALADKGGKGGGKHGGGKPAAAAHHGGGGGGGKHAWDGSGSDRGPKAWRAGGGEREFKALRAPERRFVQERREWRGGGDRFDRPVRAARYDDKPSRKAWKQAAKQHRRWAKDEAKFARAVARERFVPVERWEPPVTRYYQQPAYYTPVRYVAAAAPVWGYAASNDWWGHDELPLSYGYYDDPYAGWPTNYASEWPTNYDSGYAGYRSGLFGGGGDGLLGALLPVVLSSMLGGGELDGLGGLTGLGSPDVLPLDAVGYADPYSYDSSDGLSSLLLPTLFSGGGGLF